MESAISSHLDELTHLSFDECILLKSRKTTDFGVFRGLVQKHPGFHKETIH